MLYQKPSFSVPATTPTKKPCAVHHFVKGKCLRCDERIVARETTACACGAPLVDGSGRCVRCGERILASNLTDGSEGEE